MSLTSCLKKAGTALHADDKKAVLAAAAKYRKEGLSADAAAIKAIGEVLAGVRGDLGGAEKDAGMEPVKAAAPEPTHVMEPVEPAPAPTAAPKPAGGRTARGAAWDRNPLKAFLGQHGIALSLAKEFAPGTAERRAAMVPGHGPIFRKTGKQLDELAQLAHQDGYLPEADATRMHELIAAVMRGERVAPMYGQDAEQEIERRVAEAQERAAEAALAELPDAAVAELAQNDDDIPWGDVQSNVSVEQMMRTLGFTDQEIQDALAHQAAQESGLAQEARAGSGVAGETAPGQAEGTAGQGAAAPAASEGLNGRVTRDSALPDSSIVRDDKGREYRVHYQRNALVIAHPIENGKAQVSSTTSVRFWTDPSQPSASENDRTDPIYLVSKPGAATDLLGEAPNASQQAAAAAKAALDEKARKQQQSAPEADGFTLSGSDRAADQGAANGQEPMFARGRLTPEQRGENFRTWGRGAPTVTSKQADTHQFKSGVPVVVEAYHGTKRPDRVGDTFKRSRATSGPMAFFTSAPQLASTYAQGKEDTSLANEDQQYANWFKVKFPGERTAVPIDRAWYRLPESTKAKILEMAPRVRTDDTGENIILGDESETRGNGGYHVEATRTAYDRRGNPLKALVDAWLDSASLYGEEERFLKVLELAGLPVKDVTYDSPHAEYPFVYHAFIRMSKPLVTSDIPQEVKDALEAAAKRDRSRAQPAGSDMWDKNTRTLREWVANFTDPANASNSYVWTSIPDKVTEVFKSLGYDGIVDWSNKGGSGTHAHPVYIPFEESQVKSAIGNKGTYSPDKKSILLARSGAPAPLTKADVDAFEAAMKAKHGLHTLDLRLDAKTGDVRLDTIATTRTGTGAGTAAMRDLVDWADKHGTRLTLSLAEKGYQPIERGPKTTSPDRLRAFYKRFGFVDNKGRRKDFTLNDSMYRDPAGQARRSPDEETERRKATGASVQQVQAEVDKLAADWAAGPPIEVVPTAADLPIEAPADARGLLYRGQVYIVADGHRADGNLAHDVGQTLAHEAISHFGLRKLLGAEWGKLHANIQLALASGNKPMQAIRTYLRKTYVDETGKYTLNPRQESDELAARAIEQAVDDKGQFRPGFGFLKAVWSKVAGALRAMGIKVPFTTAELHGILVRAQSTLKTGQRGEAVPGEGARFMYGGREAMTGPRGDSERAYRSLREAHSFEEAGFNPAEVRRATGWFKGPHDGKWRFELPDHNARLVDWDSVPASKLFGEAHKVKLGEVLDHPELLRAYPELANVDVIKRPGFFDFGGLQGWFDGKNEIGITPYAKDPLSTLLHEVQHWVQAKEGFASGGNENMVFSAMTPEQKERMAAKVVPGVERRMADASADLAGYKLAIEGWDWPEAQAARKAEGVWEAALKASPNATSPERQAAHEAATAAKAGVMARLLGLPVQEWKSAFDRPSYFSLSPAQRIAYLRLSSAGGSAADLLVRKQDAETTVVTLQKMLAGLHAGDESVLEEAIKASGQGHALYKAIAGEIEARDTQARQQLTPEQRDATEPFSSEQFDPKDVITTYGGSGESQSSDRPVRTVQVDGVRYPDTNSKGQVIHSSFQGQVNFWRFMRGSKVVDAQGRPRVMYHGTLRDFSVFDRRLSVNELGRHIGPDSIGSWFSTNPSADGGAGMYGSTVMPVYLAIKKPYETTFADLMDALDDKMPKADRKKRKPGPPEVEELRAELKHLGYDGIRILHDKAREAVSTEFKNQDVWIALEPTQIKSATGNVGQFDATNPNILESRTAAEPPPPLETHEVNMAPALATTMRRWQKGRLGERELAAAIAADLEARRMKREDATGRDRVRGPDWIRERLLRARRQGELPVGEGQVDLALWMLEQAPHMANDLALSIRTRGGSPELGAQGTYNSVERVVTLFTDAGQPETAVHEILHHTERMMPRPVQDGIRAEWLRQLERAVDTAKAGLAAPKKKAAGPMGWGSVETSNAEDNTAEIAKALDAMLMAARMGDTDLTMAIWRGKKDVSPALSRLIPYALSTPSEFWAVNGARIIAERGHAAGGSWVDRAVQWLKELAEKARGLLGLKSDAAVLRGLRNVIEGNGTRVSPMLAHRTGAIHADETTPPIPTSAQARLMGEPDGWDMPPDSRTDRFIREMQDGRIDLKRVQQAIAAAGREIDQRFDARQAETLYPGRVDRRSKTFLQREARPLLDAMARAGASITELSDYLIARHAPDRNALIAQRNPDLKDGGAGTNSAGELMTTAAANAYIAAIPAERRAQLEELARFVDRITKGTRELLVTEGLEKRATIEGWERALGSKYVPLFKESEDESDGGNPHPIGSGFSVRGSASKATTGSTRQVQNVLAHVFEQREAAITRAEKNRVAMGLYGLALSNPNRDFWTTIRPGMTNEAIGHELAAMGVNIDAAVAGMERTPTIRGLDPVTGQVVDRPNPMFKSLPGALVVRIKGEDRVLMLNTGNPRAARMAAALKNQDGLTNLDLAGSIIGKGTRWIASVNTQYNPVFGLRNIFRDVWGGIVNLGSTPLRGHGWTVLRQLPAAMAGITASIARDENSDKPWARLWEQFQNDGGRTGWRDSFKDPNERAKAIEAELKHLQHAGRLTPRAVASRMLHLLDHFNVILENSVRLSAYKAALDMGLSRERAAVIGRELTVDFNRKGRLGRELNPVYAFFNASVQGAARHVETLQGPTGKYVFAGGILLGALQVLALAMGGYDDDELSDFDLARAFIIPMGRNAEGKKQHLKLPYPIGLNILPNTGRILTKLLLSGGKDMTKNTAQAVSSIVDALSPLGGADLIDNDGHLTAHGALSLVSPTVTDPLVDLASNRNFAGTAIEREARNSGDNRPGYQRAREGTLRSLTGDAYTGVAKAINSMTGGSPYEPGYVSPTPERLRYITETIGGGVVRELEKGADSIDRAARGEPQKGTNLPAISGFYGEVDNHQLQQSRYFDATRNIDKLQASIAAATKAGDREELAKLLARPEARMSRAENAIQSRLTVLNKLAAQTISDREQMKEIDKAREQTMQQLNDALIELERQSREPTLGDRLRKAVGPKAVATP